VNITSILKSADNYNITIVITWEPVSGVAATSYVASITASYFLGLPTPTKTKKMSSRVRMMNTKLAPSLIQ
jgi:hypothetical protein